MKSPTLVAYYLDTLAPLAYCSLFGRLRGGGYTASREIELGEWHGPESTVLDSAAALLAPFIARCERQGVTWDYLCFDVRDSAGNEYRIPL